MQLNKNKKERHVAIVGNTNGTEVVSRKRTRSRLVSYQVIQSSTFTFLTTKP